MESSITATPPSCQWKGEKGIISRRYVCVVIPVCISLFCECLASLLSQFFAMPKAHFSFGCISSQCQKVASARFVLHVSVCSIFFFFAIIPVYEIFKESARQLLVWASLCHINEARDLCRAHSLSGYNNTWSLPPVRARIKGKTVFLVHCPLSHKLVLLQHSYHVLKQFSAVLCCPQCDFHLITRHPFTFAQLYITTGKHGWQLWLNEKPFIITIVPKDKSVSIAVWLTFPTSSFP